MSGVRISTVVAVRDAEAYIGPALESILGQTRPPDQVIAVDDGSTDGTARVIEGFGDAVTLIRQAAASVGAALNSGLELADGEWLSFLDADDLWTARKLELQAAVLASNPEIDVVFGHVKQFISPELSPEQRAELRAPGESAPAKLKGTLLIRREAFDRVGRLDTFWKVADFFDWYIRSREQGLREEMLDEVVLLRRLHTHNLGRRPEAREEYAAALAMARQRRRSSFPPYPASH